MNTIPDPTHNPELADVTESFDITANERAELDAVAAEGKAPEPNAQVEAEKAEADAAAQKAIDDAAAADATAKAEKAAADEAAAAAEAAAKPAAPAVVLMPVPEAPKDFAAARAELKQKFDDGDLDAEEYADAREELTIERARFESAKETAERINAERKAEAEAAAAAADPATFENVSAKWATENAAFMANSLRAKAMQDAIEAVDRRTGGKLAPAELIQKAQAEAFEAFGWKGAATTKSDTPDPKKVKEVMEGRKPKDDQVPLTLGDAPNAGSDLARGSSSDLDAGSIVDMEMAVAGMNPAEREKWLREVDPA